jgi:hypothetical protein
LLLLAGTLVTILVTLALRARGEHRVIYAALLSAGLASAVHAGIDWDWQMPVVTAWIFAVAGAALAGEASARRASALGPRVRGPLAVALLVVAATPVLLMLSEVHLQRAASAFQSGNCTRADSQAVASIDVLSIRP